MSDATSAADARAAVADWYQRAEQLRGLMRYLATLANDDSPRSIGFYLRDPDPPLSQEQVDKMLRNVVEACQARVKILKDGAERLLCELGALRTFTASDAIWETYKPAYLSLGDFSAGEYRGGRAAWAVLQPLGYDMRRWACELSRLWGERSIVIDHTAAAHAEAFEAKRQECPFTGEIDAALGKRLFAEQAAIEKHLLEREASERQQATLEAILALSVAGGKSDNEEQAKEQLIAQLPESRRLAMFAYQYAQAMLSRTKLAYADAWDYLKENGIEGVPELESYRLPSKDTFSDYVSKALGALGESRRSRTIASKRQGARGKPID
jgi:hypothetical protein